MIKVNSTGSISSAKPAAKKKKSSPASSDAFSSIMDVLGASSNATSSSTAVSDVAVSSMDMILSVQGIPSELTERQQQIRSAELTLDALEKLRNGLLMGEVPTYLLHDIERRMSEMRAKATDPDLIDVLEDIELRAAVELAKFKFDA